ncbi:hypothetical protein GLOIN_2v1769236 [Rhizophagus irregularis DAOM 181602=DAOM 197198]|uniref:Uncharacterized protein n=1 Tax=Rhizophagus irregularis (strain DAOM 181602 / DAOM 197198 / MUCL 43194) TaxID=747089 RepID=A0A2P4QF13_RHIID|nr:hypothetical protein GLOIN_2v1769236 [Rhizophagus irregularis DAOM 181602=DAOM 197198]POG76218.1 hypothetical protein GLOIN_2v1769236 [Rhizophagus irregularis DAOM 181602=DAOM 197198]GET53136.1 hypothetical protein GLOIN_2v1769236 [Rhizophagus irregularis DAOM 181602=DAOM 197198]|eukprot:XP_025183084.1 hypothetical protein GLOIN_2v1769236 [Rhizophagus irregularis DAOM 181602=DAOM 197198]
MSKERSGELEEENILKVNTIQNWINTYAYVLKERATDRDLANECENQNKSCLQLSLKKLHFQKTYFTL